MLTFIIEYLAFVFLIKRKPSMLNTQMLGVVFFLPFIYDRTFV